MNKTFGGERATTLRLMQPLENYLINFLINLTDYNDDHIHHQIYMDLNYTGAYSFHILKYSIMNNQFLLTILIFIASIIWFVSSIILQKRNLSNSKLDYYLRTLFCAVIGGLFTISIVLNNLPYYFYIFSFLIAVAIIYWFYKARQQK